ncbi:MAG: transketolase, partial [Phototrophicales bacterium]
EEPDWANRDRIIFSCGHGSALWYSVLYGFGILQREDLANFRQLYSKTPGHLELSQGVDMTTGPLGQGFAWAVGMAFAERIMNAKTEAIDHHTFVLCSDGDLMEGLSYEAA